MDWAWVYGTLIRNAGWTLEQCWEQPAADVFDFLSHLAEYPPDYVILAAVHLKPKPAKQTPAQFEAQLPQLEAMLGEGPAQPIPADLRSALAWMEEQKKLMRL